MDSKLARKRVIENLKDWYVIDSILFNDHARHVIKKGSVFKEYVALKGVFLSNLYEFWAKVGYEPTTDKTYTNVKQLQEAAVKYSRKGKSLAADLMVKESIKSKIKNYIIRESKKKNISDLDKFQDKVIKEKHLQFSLDNCLIGLPLLESRNTSSTCDFDCAILREAHVLMRNQLIRLALTCEKFNRNKFLQEFEPMGRDNESEDKRLKRLTNQMKVGLGKKYNYFISMFDLRRIPAAMWSNVYNTAKMVAKLGDGDFSRMKADLNKLAVATADGKIKTGKEYNEQINKILKKYGYKEDPYRK